MCVCNVHYNCNPQPLPFKSQTFLNKVKPLLLTPSLTNLLSPL